VLSLWGTRRPDYYNLLIGRRRHFIPSQARTRNTLSASRARDHPAARRGEEVRLASTSLFGWRRSKSRRWSWPMVARASQPGADLDTRWIRGPPVASLA